MGPKEFASHFTSEPKGPVSGKLMHFISEFVDPANVPLGAKFIGEKLSGVFRKEKPAKEDPEIMAGRQEEIITKPAMEGEILGPIDKVNDFPPQTDTLEESLNEGPSKLIVAGLKESLNRIAKGDKTKIETPWVAWVLNPKAGVQIVKSLTDRALAVAKVKRSVAEAFVWLAEAVEKDVRSDALNSRIDALEGRHGNNQGRLEDFRNRHNLEAIPNKEDFERQQMLLTIEGEQVALQKGADRWARRAGELMERAVDIQLDTDENRMLVSKMPGKIESMKSKNVLIEEESGERARHITSTVGQVMAEGATGAAVGPLKGLKNAIQAEVKAHPELAVSFFSFAGGTSVLVVLYGSALTWEKIGIACAGGGVLCLTCTIGAAAILGLKQHQEAKRRQSEIQQA